MPDQRTTDVLAASEIVLLHGADFAPPARLSADALLLDPGRKVDRRKLLTAAYLAALAANVRAGVVTVTQAERKTLFALRTVHDVTISRTGTPSSWPEPSVEALLAGLSAGRTLGMDDLWATVLGPEKHADPAREALERMKQCLALRGLLDAEGKRVLKIIPKLVYTASDATRAAAAANPAAPVRQLLDAYAAAEPAVTDVARARLAAALAARTITSNDVMPADYD